ncbi:MAG: peptide deformylase [Candidatus Sungbacteria bacterium RIFCSPHIGHO2_02_FULL_49_12]|uniref:Peptide deformylase n=1 Tax=Candidatus Sungbacteria bacterium RIFCSPHIGHO2_02_FULL_49_12 TaxID=1802271 RepID=A0A1G2KPZ4_9BACT|nr:MAG: peptide deformylase [Candidatus Sungbacteria bacterium RIFCSPHIGHO2_02_FULL_49_12]
MSIKKTYQIGTKVIRSHANEVRKFNNPAIQKTIRDLIDSMRHNNLVGMAAPQIGKELRIFVTEIRKTKFRKAVKEDKLRTFINPRIVKKSKRQVIGFEGCGSVAAAGLFGQVRRSESVEVSAFNAKGQPFRLKADSLLARIIQHEIDHLNGIVFIDHVSDTRTLLDRETYIESQKNK